MQPGQLEQLLAFLLESLQQMKDFTLEQAPIVVQELLAWKFYEAGIWAGVFIVTAGVIAFMVPRMIRAAGEMGDDEGRGMDWFFRIAAVFILVIGVGFNVGMMIKIKVAPRVVVMETIRNLITGQR